MPDRKNNLDFIVAFDRFIAGRNYSREEICLKGILLNALTDLNQKYPVPRRFMKAIHSLQKLDVVISRSDKDGKIVIMDKDFYLNKINQLLSDTNTYDKLTKNPLQNVPTEFFRKVRSIGKDKKSIELLEKFKVINPKLPYFYGLPKTHKDNLPFRPIISCAGAFNYNISKWLAGLLSPFLGTFSPSHIKHSEDFVHKFKAAHIPIHNIQLLSLDVDSLFTKVPVQDILQFLRDKLAPYSDHFPLALDKIIKLVELCVSNNVFSFGDSFYRQKFGCSMGSPLSPVLANLYMEYFETSILNTIKPKDMLWMRYVDDIITFWDDRWGNFNDFLSKLNALVPSIKFKVEWETNNKIPFLDVLIIRDTTEYKFSVYRKPTFSLSYIHFFSYHDISIKIGVASNLFLRALRICSPEHLENEFKLIRKQLSSLKYPDHITEKAIQKANIIFYRPPQNTTRETPNNKIKIPHLDKIKTLTQPFGNSNPFVFTYPNTLGKSLINVQQRLSSKDIGVYEIPCLDCDQSYFGFTGKTLSQRLVQHKRAVKYGQQSSAIFNHINNYNHRINWNMSRTIYGSNCRFKCQMIESAIIKRRNSMNLSKGAWEADLIDEIFLRPAIKKISHKLSSGVT